MSTQNTLLTIAKVLTVSAEAYIVFDYFDAFYDRKVKRSFFLLGVLLFMLITLVISYLDFENKAYANLPIAIFLVLLSVLLLYKGSPRAIIISTVIFYLVYLAGELIVYFSLNLLAPFTVSDLEGVNVVNIPFLVYDRIFLFIIFKGVVQARRSSQNKLLATDFISLISVSAISLFVTLTLFISDSVNNDTQKFLSFFVSLGLFVSNIVIFNLFLKSTKYAKIELEQSLIRQNMESSEKRYSDLIMIQNQIRGMWHDINNHIAVAKGMIEKENGSAGKYIDELEKKVGDYASQVTFGNSIIDTILYAKTMKAKELGIDISTNLDMDKNIGINPVDLCAIFSNALDNAIEACEEVEPDKRFIRLKGVQNQGMLFIKIANSSNARSKNGGGFRTTKSEREQHGIGLKSIQNAVDSYFGTMSTDYKDGIFELNIMMNAK